MARNMSIEEAAILAVIEFEMDRLSLNTSDDIKVVKEDGYDVLSADGRTIEVKGSDGNMLSKGLVLNSSKEYEHLEKGGYLYRVLNCNSSPKVHVFQFDDLNISEEYRAKVTIKAKNQLKE